MAAGIWIPAWTEKAQLVSTNALYCFVFFKKVSFLANPYLHTMAIWITKGPSDLGHLQQAAVHWSIILILRGDIAELSYLRVIRVSAILPDTASADTSSSPFFNWLEWTKLRQTLQSNRTIVELCKMDLKLIKVQFNKCNDLAFVWFCN